MAEERGTGREVDRELLEESLEELYENAPAGYFSTLPDGSFVKVNQTFLEWIGYSRHELLGGKRFQNLLTVAGKIYHDTHYGPLLQMQGFVNEIAFDLVCQNGGRLPVLINTVQKRNADGTPLLNRTTVFNASDRRKYEQELLRARREAEQAAEVKARFLSTVSHEIRNPLGVITMASQRLEQVSSDPRQQRYIRMVKSSAESLLALVNDLLDYSRIDAGRVVLEERPFDLRDLVMGIVERMEDRAEEKGLDLVAEIDPRVPANLLGDPLKIGQVLTNLLGNALKFTERGSVRVIVQVREMHPDVLSLDFKVRDTGIGIAPNRLAYIFEEFAQASPDITRKYGGTGLGLAISRKLLELYDSQLEVESVLGAGSTFFFTLSLRRGSEDPPA